MDIYATEGTKVVFIEENVSQHQINYGGHDDPNGLLEVGKEYTIDRTVVYAWSTDVYLKEFPGVNFNSVWFA